MPKNADTTTDTPTEPPRDASATGEKRARPAGKRGVTRKRRSGETLTAAEVAAAKGAFLDAYAQHGNVGAACDAARIHRSTVYRWMEHDETFGLLYEQAKTEYDDLIREEIDRRARRGWSETVYQLAKRAGTVRKYSDTLLIFHAKARMPEYRDKVDVQAHLQAGSGDGADDTAEAAALARGFLFSLGSLATQRPGDADGSGASGE